MKRENIRVVVLAPDRKSTVTLTLDEAERQVPGRFSIDLEGKVYTYGKHENVPVGHPTGAAAGVVGAYDVSDPSQTLAKGVDERNAIDAADLQW